MMRPPIDAFDDGVGGALQLIIQPARDQSAEHRVGGLVAMHSEAGDVRLATGAGHRPMHSLDDVAADSELTQRLLEAGLQGPASRPDLLCQAQAFELCGAAEHETGQIGIPA
jgi:hypothetical protein